MRAEKEATTWQETRKAMRYRVSAPVTFTWEQENKRQVGEGVTRDMSSRGIFIWSPALPPIGTQLECEVFIPKNSPSDTSLKVLVKGLIKRIDSFRQLHNAIGFAVESKRVAISTEEEPFPEHETSSMKSAL